MVDRCATSKKHMIMLTLKDNVMTLDYFIKLYLSWRNDFLTIEAFASYYGISEEKAKFIADAGYLIGMYEKE